MASSNRFSSVASDVQVWLRERFVPQPGGRVPDEDTTNRRGFIVAMCLLIAVVLWFTLSIGETYTILVELPTEVVNLPDDMALAALPPRTVQVQVRGEGTALFGIRFDPPQLSIDADQDEVNFSTLVSLPPGIDAENVVPLVHILQKEERITRLVPVRSQAVIEAAETHDFFTAPVLMPDSIAVSGARSIINALDTWPTEPFQHTGLTDTLTVTIPLVDTLGGLVERSHDAVTLATRAHEFTEDSRVLKIQVTEVPTTQRVVYLEPSTVRVTYRVPLSQYDAAQTAPDFYATVPYGVIRTDTTGRVRPQMHLPTRLSLRQVDWSPLTVRYYESLIEQ